MAKGKKKKKKAYYGFMVQGEGETFFQYWIREDKLNDVEKYSLKLINKK